jgi:hypothetical protein
LQRLLKGLSDLDAIVLVVLHVRGPLEWSFRGSSMMEREGFAAIKKAGGVAMVQSPGEAAAYPDMPRNAIKYDGPDDLVASIPDLATEIVRPTGTTPAKRKSVDVPHGRGS